MRAGAHSVMASSWPVWNPSIEPLIRDFYRRLGQDEGIDLAEALMASARTIRDGGTQKTRHAPVAAATPFWKRMLGGSAEKAGPMAASARHRLKMPVDHAQASAARQTLPMASDPDTAPANWSHPHFWVAFAIHGSHDSVGT
jgi:CHAT domain-containing protein